MSAIEELRATLDDLHHQDMPLQSIRGLLNDLLNEVENMNGVLQSATVLVSSAQILALHDTPATLVEAPGVGKAVIPIFVVGSTSGGTPYDVSGAGSLRLLGLLDPGGLGNVSNALGYAGDETAYEDFGSILGGDYNDTVNVDNQALSMTYDTDNPTGGDTTLKITTFYVVADLA